MLQSLWNRILRGGNAGPKVEVRLSLRLNARRRQVAVAGSFNRWSSWSHALTLAPSGTWETVLRLLPGTYQYRFLVDNSEWMLDPLAGTALNEYGGMNSVLVVRRPEAAPARESRVAEGQYA